MSERKRFRRVPRRRLPGALLSVSPCACRQARREAGLLDAAVAGEVGPRRRGRTLARARVARRASDDVVEVVVGEAAPDLVVRVRQATVQPEARRLDRPGGEHDDLRRCRRLCARARVAPRDRPRVSLGPHLHRKGVGDKRRRTPVRPAVGGQSHRHVADVRRALCLEVQRRLQRQEAALRTVAAERAALRARVHELLRLRRLAGRPVGLQDRVLLRAARGAGDVLGGLRRQADAARRPEEELLLRPQRRGLHGQRVLDPFVVRDQVAITREHVGHRARRVAEVVQRGAADAGCLPHEAVLWEIARPRCLRAVAGTEAEDSGRRVVGRVLVVRPLALGVLPGGAGLEQQHVEAARRELLRDHRTAAARADDDDIRHASSL
jgi:hypothetical protein